MIRSIALRWLLVSLPFSLPAVSAFAETVELVTYYPTAATTGDTHVQSLTVGTGYNNVTPGDGEAFIENLLSVGSTNPVVNIGGGGARSRTRLWLQDDTPGSFPALVIAGTPGVGGGGGGAVQFVDATTNAAVGDFGFSGVAAAASEVGIAARRNNASISFYTTPAPVPPAAERPFLRMVISPAGNVGIGTPNPAGLLHVVGNNDATSNVLFMPGNDDPGVPGVAQIRVGIGTTAPATSSALEISSATQGFLPPRMTMAQRNLIAAPVQGLVIYNTTTTGSILTMGPPGEDAGRWFRWFS